MRLQKPGGLYQDMVNSEEVTALEKWNWPTQVSSQVLPALLSGKTIIDIGAGPNRNLGDIVAERGGKYIAVDINDGFVEIQRNLGREVYKGDVTRLTKDLAFLSDRKTVITHTRLVIMHVVPEKRRQAIRELSIIGSSGYILDSNWENFIHGTSSELMRNFIAITLNFARWKGIDLDHGGKLKKLVAETLGEAYEITEQIFLQGVANHFGEIIDLAQREVGAFLQDGDKKKVGELKALIKEFENIQQENNPRDYFEMPCIHVVSFTEK